MNFKIVKAEIVRSDKSNCSIVLIHIVEDGFFAEEIEPIELIPPVGYESEFLRKWKDAIDIGIYPVYTAEYIIVEDLPEFKEPDIYDEETFPFYSNSLRVLIRTGNQGELTESPRNIAIRTIVENGWIVTAQEIYK